MLRAALVLLLVAGCAAPGPRASPVRLAYTVTGEGPVVVLLHGHPQTAGSWRAVAPVLATR